MNIVKYPIGIQTFEQIRTKGYVYADKTGYIHDLLNSGSKYHVLHRPRRFGKSLLLSTLKSYFEGREDLFKGLKMGELETTWEKCPVLKFSFGSIYAENITYLLEEINAILKSFETEFEVKINDDVDSIGTRFGLLIENIAQKTGKKVVVLIDEYNKGVVDVLQNQSVLKRNLNLFRHFYSQLKEQEQNLCFVLLTGVFCFSNLSLFASQNQFHDISLAPRYAAICGLTKEEVDTVFVDGIEELARENNYSIKEAKEQLRVIYGGYRFTRKETTVYNPSSILKCLSESHLGDFWISSGLSMVFVDYLKESHCNTADIEKKDNIWVHEDSLYGQYSLTDPVPMLFQTGNLTIKDYNDYRYLLGFTNDIVRRDLLEHIIPEFLGTEED